MVRARASKAACHRISCSRMETDSGSWECPRLTRRFDRGVLELTGRTDSLERCIPWHAVRDAHACWRTSCFARASARVPACGGCTRTERDDGVKPAVSGRRVECSRGAPGPSRTRACNARSARVWAPWFAGSAALQRIPRCFPAAGNITTGCAHARSYSDELLVFIYIQYPNSHTVPKQTSSHAATRVQLFSRRSGSG
jgi:hypothetical protein